MARDEIRISVPAGPNQLKQAAAIMAELQRRVWEEEQERERQATLPTDEHDVIEGEVADGEA